jgi:hypothetical protein
MEQHEIEIVEMKKKSKFVDGPVVIQSMGKMLLSHPTQRI